MQLKFFSLNTYLPKFALVIVLKHVGTIQLLNQLILNLKILKNLVQSMKHEF